MSNQILLVVLVSSLAAAQMSKCDQILLVVLISSLAGVSYYYNASSNII